MHLYFYLVYWPLRFVFAGNGELQLAAEVVFLHKTPKICRAFLKICQLIILKGCGHVR